MDSSESLSDDKPPIKEPSIDTSIPICNPNSWSGPRTVLLKRNEHGFGFTLRHFIVYPPDVLKDSINEWADKQDAEKIQFPSMEPMDTIFVKNVKEGGPADRAGLAAGDRIVSVNGETIRGKTYPQVVQMIQKSDNNLQLLVVPKEDDILQLYFPGSAYHPGADVDGEVQATPPRQNNSQIHTIYPPSSSSSSSISNLSLDSLQRFHKPGVAIAEYTPRFYGSNEPLYQSSTNYHMPKNQRPRFNQPSQQWNRSYEAAPPEFQSRFGSYNNQTADGRSRSNSDLFTSQTTDERKLSFPAFFHTENRIYDSNENLEPQHFVHKSNEPTQHFYDAPPTNDVLNNPIRPVFSQIYVPTSYQQQQPHQSECFVVPNIQGPALYSGEKMSTRDKFFRSCAADQASVWSNNNNNNNNPSIREQPYKYGAFDPLTDRMKAGLEKRQEFLFNSPFQEPAFSPAYRNDSVKYIAPYQPIFRSSLEQTVGTANPPLISQLSSSSEMLPVKCTSTLVHFPSNNLDEEPFPRTSSKAFVSKLGRIQENITSGSLSDCATQSTSRLSQGGFSQNKRKALMTPLRKANSLDSDVSNSSIHVNDNENGLQLQLVSQRAKLFESGSVESESRNRLKLYQNELSRLSTKGKTTSVSERTAQFESLSTSQETVSSESEGPLVPRHRISLENKKESKELRWQRSQSDNVTPGHYSSTTSVPKSVCATTPVQVTSNVPSMSTSSEPAFIDDEAEGDEDDLPNRRKAVRQNSYLQAVHSPYKDRIGSNKLNRFYSTSRFHNRVSNHPLSRECSSTPSLHLNSNGLAANDSPERQNSLHGADCSSLFEEGSISRLIAAFDSMLAGNVPPISSTPAKSDSDSAQHSIAGIVLKKKSLFEDEAQNARRVAYLKATAVDRMRTTSEGDEEAEKNNTKTPISQRSHSIQKLKAFFGEKTPQIVEAAEHIVKELPSPVYDVVKEGWLNCKTAFLDGKRATDRSWKQLWACLRGSTVYLFKDKKDSYQLPLCLEEQPVVIRPSSADIAHDYTKKKNVFRLITATGSEYLLQAEDNDDMLHWLKLIQEHYQANNLDANTPRKGDHMSRLSPQPVQKGIKKLTSFRNRSPTGHSPLVKIKRTAQGDEMPPKAKTWRGKMAKTIKKIHSTSTTSSSIEDVTVNVPLEECPSSSINEFVPLIVELCTSIVEARGLEMVGIYRVPGNTAAVTTLLDAINKGFDTLNLQDPRWNDVNVISSVLKGFFRKLPEPLMTSELYPLFIEANKIENTTQKMCTIKKLLHELPDHHYETLKYLIRHLQKVVLHSNINKMEARNLAIVFGPTLVRAADDNMVTMVNDMSHQCCIVELLINKVDWFFNDDETDDFINQNIPENIFTIDQQTISNQNLLLNNITKMEDVIKPREICVRDIVTSIINAANRKVRQRVKKQSVSSSSTFGEDAGFEERDIDREVELRRQRVQKHQDAIDSASGRPGSAETKSQCNRDLTTQKRTISADSLNSLQMQSTSSLTDGSTHESGELFYFPNETVTPEKIGDEVVFRTYAGLSASTQERIRRFEMETRALLQRNLNRQNQDSERRKLERRRIELEWQRAKQDLDQEILLDELTNRGTLDPSKPTKHRLDVNSLLSDYSSALRDSRPSINSQSSSSDYSSNASPIVRHRLSEPCNQGLHTSTLITSDYNSNTSSPLSTTSSDVKVPTDKSGIAFHKSQLKLELTAPKIDGKEKIIDVHLRRGCSVENVKEKLPTEENKNRQENEGKLKKRRLSSIRCGSLDSLREFYDKESQSGVEEGGDLLNSITSTLNQRLRGLFDPNTNESKEDKNLEIKKSEEKKEENSTPQAERKRRYRDPSLHRTREKSEESPKLQKAAIVNVKHNAALTENKIPHAHRNCCSACPYLKHTTKDEKGDVNTQKKPSKVITTAAATCVKHSVIITTPKITASSISKTEKLQDNQQNKKKLNQRHNEIEFDNHCEKPLSSIDVSSSSLTSTRCKNGVNRSVKRRHTVGGTKDFENFRSILSGNSKKSMQKSAWERLRPETDENLSRERNIKSWLQRERLRTSSPDLSAQKLYSESTRPEELIGSLKNQQRRISFPDIRLASLQLSQAIALESQV